MLFLFPLTKYWSLSKKRRKAPRSPTKPYTKGGVRYQIIKTCKDWNPTYLKEKRKKNNERFPQNKSKNLLSIYVGLHFCFLYTSSRPKAFSPKKKEKKEKQPKLAQPPFLTSFLVSVAGPGYVSNLIKHGQPQFLFYFSLFWVWKLAMAVITRYLRQLHDSARKI